MSEMNTPEENIQLILKAVEFAAYKHRDQKRKDKDATPYINHPIKVANILIDVGKIYDTDTIIAAILHDTIEDTETTAEEITNNFSGNVSKIVLELTDDKSFLYLVRKRKQIEKAKTLSHQAKNIKIADKICNVHDVTNHPPKYWDLKRRKEYFLWAEKVVNEIRGTNEELEKLFDEKLKAGYKKINEESGKG
jgi:GTP diphosphokinase / guanosine-3',5'-bis(diphosphate) 3'-diphosphatase